ncbi:glyoxylase-like metal-dependent hydrolase (beta-lactamase superfamily II) [Sphingobium jiangsuense]|uniref:Glyoxylase-like metal-dependent hydrolase (Beta-lactamase superfamily II) n=1 Tax=Sphingobium jiangsuense TaxID=870476 RepID=A0A7W6BTA4_9SPHN|nr:hypothetical protein [Sphingobium jiangsuense]MBB3928373.1 glyoxylase-like metal-dependent hydrolase (beta-lactamase superfamily II) [Sphingobium jiangsuense]
MLLTGGQQVEWTHPIDAPRIEAGTTMRPMTPSRVVRNRLLVKVLGKCARQVEPSKVDRLIEDGDSPDFAHGMTALHVPGHCAGQVALPWRRDGGSFFTADACVNRSGLQFAAATEDPRPALTSLARLVKLKFVKACVVHRPRILSSGAQKFRRMNFDTLNLIRTA